MSKYKITTNDLKHQKTLLYGCEVAFKSEEFNGYLSSPGIADRRLVIRSDGEGPMSHFERCVFVIVPVDEWKGVEEVAYGSSVCLMHKFTRLYMTVQRHECAVLDNSCLKMTLQTREEAGGNCNFKILPRFKIRSEGDAVLSGENVLLQVEHSDLHVHASVPFYPIGSNTRFFTSDEGLEINAGEDPTTFTISRFDIGVDNPPLSMFKETNVDIIQQPSAQASGSLNPSYSNVAPKEPLGLARTIVILHKETETVLSCNTAFQRNAEATSNAFTRESTIHNITSLLSGQDSQAIQISESRVPYWLPSERSSVSCSFDVANCSCNSLWLFENSDPTKGGLICVGVLYRLRHIASGRYLCVSPEAELSMEDIADKPKLLEASLFTLHSVLDKDMEIIHAQHQFLHIQHHLTGLYLCSDKSILRRDSTLRYLSVSEQPNIEDAVAIYAACVSTQQDLNTLVGNIDYLLAYVKHFVHMQHPAPRYVNDAITKRVIRRAQDALKELILFCTKSDEQDPLKREGLPIRTHQQMLGDLQIHKLTFEVLAAPFTKEANLKALQLPLEGGVLTLDDLLKPEYSHIHMVCRLCYRLQKQMAKGNGSFAHLLEEYIPFMQNQEGYKLHVADTLLSVFSDNSELAPAVSSDACRHFVSMLKSSGRSAGYIKFLSKLCAVRDTGVQRTQEMITRLLLKENADLLIPMKVESGKIYLLLDDEWKTLKQFFLSTQSNHIKLVKYFESTVELLSKLCIGGHFNCLDAVRQFVSREHALIVIKTDFSTITQSQMGNKNNELCSRMDYIKATYLEIILHLYLKGDLDNVDEVVEHTTKITATQEMPRNLNGRRDTDFLQNLKLSLLQMLRRSQTLVYDQPNRNLQISRVIALWHLIIQYRHYTPDELKTLLSVLKNVLYSVNDKSTDEISNLNEKFDKHASSEDAVQVFAIKKGACELLLTVIEHLVGEVCDEIKKQLLATKSNDDIDGRVEKLIELCKRKIDYFYLHDMPPKDYLPLMMELVEYDSTELTVVAMRVAISLCLLTNMVSSRLQDITVLTNDEAQEKMQGVCKLLRNNVSAGGSVMNEANVEEAVRSILHLYGVEPKDIEVAEDAPSEASSGEVLPFETFSVQPGQRLPVFDFNFSVDPPPDEGGENSGAPISPKARDARRASSFSPFIEGAEGEDESLGVATNVRKRFDLHVQELHDDETYPVQRVALDERVIQNCNDLLQYYDVQKTLLEIALKIPVKTQLFRLLMYLFRCFSMSPKHIPVLVPYINVFHRGLDDTNSEPVCMFVMLQIFAHTHELTDNLERNLVKKFVERIKSKPDALVIGVLARIVMGNCPIPRNQRMVLSLLIEHHLVNDIGKVRGTWPPQELEINYAIVDLIVYCCVGNNGTRSTGQQLLPLQDLYSILLAKGAQSLQKVHQVVYLRYLGSIFLAHDETQTSKESKRWRKLMTSDEDWWKLCKIFIVYLRNFEPSTADVFQKEHIGGGVIPCLSMYFEFNFDPAYVMRCSSTMRIITSMQDLCDVLYDRWKVFFDLTPSFRKLVSVLHETAITSELRMEEYRDKLMSLTPWPAREESAIDEKDAKHHEILRRTQSCFAERFATLRKDMLVPLVTAVYAAPNQIKSKLVSHLRKHEFDQITMVGLLMAFRHNLEVVIEQLEDVEVTEESRRDLLTTNLMNEQCLCEKIGMMSVVTTLLESSHDDVIANALGLGIAMLEGGNKSVQQSLLHYFEATDEKFFLSVRKFVEDAVIEIKHTNSTRQQWICSVGRQQDTSGPQLKFIQEIFRLLQLMCEGHNYEMQNYIRVQRDNLHSVNVLKDVMSFVTEVVLGEITESNLPIITQSFDLLTEFCQGPCEMNQLFLSRMKVCERINRVLHHPGFNIQHFAETINGEGNEKDQKLLALKTSAATTLLSLLEGCNQSDIPSIIVRQVQIDRVTDTISQFQKLYTGDQLHDIASENENLDLVFHLMILLASLSGFSEYFKEPERVLVHKGVSEFKALSTLLGRIEILRGDRLEEVYFRIPAVCNTLTEASKQELLWGVNRSTQGSKLADFFERSEALIYEMDTAYDLRRGIMGLNRRQITKVTNIDVWDNVSISIALVTNLVFITLTSDPNEFMDSDMNFFGAEGMVYALTFVQLLVTLVIFVLDTMLCYPLLRFNWEKEVQRKARLIDVKDEKEIEKRFGSWDKHVMFQQLVMSRFQTVYRAFMVMGSLAALKSSYFLAVHLLGLIYKSEILTNVVVAVTQNSKSLLFTMGLGCIIGYFFSIIGFVYFQDEFDDQESVCRTLMACFIHVMSSGVRMGGGIADLMAPAHNRPFRMLYDFLFFAFLIVIFLNIVFGIILDKFAELRESRRTKEEDMYLKCFICGIDAHNFDRYGKGFKNHTKKEHNMWNYLYFMHYLRRKDKDDFTGQETYVHNMIEQANLGFFPVGRCMFLERTKVEAQDDEAKIGDVRGVKAHAENLTEKMEETQSTTKALLERINLEKKLSKATKPSGSGEDTPPISPMDSKLNVLSSFGFDSPRIGGGKFSLTRGRNKGGLNNSQHQITQEMIHQKDTEIRVMKEKIQHLHRRIQEEREAGERSEADIEKCVQEIALRDTEITRMRELHDEIKKHQTRNECFIESLKAESAQLDLDRNQLEAGIEKFRKLLAERKHIYSNGH